MNSSPPSDFAPFSDNNKDDLDCVSFYLESLSISPPSLLTRHRLNEFTQFQFHDIFNSDLSTVAISSLVTDLDVVFLDKELVSPFLKLWDINTQHQVILISSLSSDDDEPEAETRGVRSVRLMRNATRQMRIRRKRTLQENAKA